MSLRDFSPNEIIITYNPGEKDCKCGSAFLYEGYTPVGRVFYFWCQVCDVP